MTNIYDVDQVNLIESKFFVFLLEFIVVQLSLVLVLLASNTALILPQIP